MSEPMVILPSCSSGTPEMSMAAGEGVVPVFFLSSLQAAKARTAASARTNRRREIRLRLRGDMLPSLRGDPGISQLAWIIDPPPPVSIVVGQGAAILCAVMAGTPFLAGAAALPITPLA